VCGGLDEDCDGRADEALQCEPLTPDASFADAAPVEDARVPPDVVTATAVSATFTTPASRPKYQPSRSYPACATPADSTSADAAPIKTFLNSIIPLALSRLL
jgi:hypothetical protein